MLHSHQVLASSWLNAITEEFYSTRSFVAKGILPAEHIRESCASERAISSQCSSKHIFTKVWNVRLQVSGHKVLSCSQLYNHSMGIYQVVTFPGCRAQEPENKARVPGSQQDAHEFLVWTFLIGGAEFERLRCWNSSVWTTVTRLFQEDFWHERSKTDIVILIAN